ncbi:MAG TPA: archease [Syntrophales bacterium]|nr:archease [Syntrophales bacterium]
MIRYRVFDHTADLGIQVFGRTVEEIFVNGAHALFHLIADLDQVQLTEERIITAAGTDRNELWVNYLRECLHVFNGEGLLMRECVILSLDQSNVTARLRGEILNHNRQQIKQEIKAVTYYQASVRKTKRGWIGKVICDV